MDKKVMTGAEAVIKCLLEEGTDTVFGYPGGTIMPVYDAIYDYRDQIKHILVRHEQGMVHAAQGYARASRKTGVCIATSGPGATNLITGITDAMMDSTPVVCIIGQVPAHLLGTDAFQEADIIGMTIPCTKWNFQVTDVNEIPEAISKAFYIANSGRPGPVILMLTKNAQFDSLEFSYKKTSFLNNYRPHKFLNYPSIRMAADLINSAKKPMLVFGQGIILSGAEKELDELLHKTDIPAASTLLGLSALPSEHPNYVGLLGMHGNYAPNILTNECDVLIGIGLRFDDRVTGDAKQYAKQAKIIHIEIDESELGKIVNTEVAVLGDAKMVMQALIPMLDESDHSEWKNKYRMLEQMEIEKVHREVLDENRESLSMGYVCNKLSLMLDHDAVLVTDVGQHQMIANRYFKFRQSRSVITSGGLGTMGFSLPAAIGATLAMPNRTVISICGDGGFQMTLQELGTILQNKIPVKIIILNNHFLGMVRQWQQLFFDKRYSFTEIDSPDFIKIAGAYNIPAWRVEQKDQLEESISKMINTPGATLLEVIVEKEDNVFPMVPPGAAVNEILLK